MKKFMVALLALTCSVTASQAVLSMNWNYAVSLNLAGKGTFEASWLVQMFSDVNKNTTLGGISGFTPTGTVTGGNSADDLLLGSFTTTLQSGKGGVDFAVTGIAAEALKGLNVYTVIFNAATVAGATQGIVIDANPLPVASTDDGLKVYSQSSVANNWVGVVPEPGTLALLGVGAAVIGFRRRQRR